jgi:biopolymer transport protein ExbD
MKILSPLPRKRGRIEIIPLIDIMFFLLAAFMIVSINMIKIKSLAVSLPTDVPVAQLEPKEDFISISINTFGQVQIDKDLIKDPAALLPRLQEIFAKNKDQKFLISADRDSRNGDVVAVLGKLRTAGFQRVAFALKGSGGAEPGGGGSGTAPPAEAPGAPETPSAAPAPEAPAPAAPSGTAPAAPTAPEATPPPATVTPPEATPAPAAAPAPPAAEAPGAPAPAPAAAPAPDTQPAPAPPKT